ncbi:MAG: hypothetical protein KGJ90_05925 [Patescibacteria group bacterium]|nr:hypothetical protein [Patescibacteria group bacterium]
MIEITRTRISHVKELIDNLREDDLKELKAMNITPKKALVLGYKKSIWTKTAIVNGRVAAIWGISGAPLSLVGTPWLLTSKHCESVSSIRFARIYKNQVAEMLKLFPTLENIVDASYTKAVKMLELAGFTANSAYKGFKICTLN